VSSPFASLASSHSAVVCSEFSSPKVCTACSTAQSVVVSAWHVHHASGCGIAAGLRSAQEQGCSLAKESIGRSPTHVVGAAILSSSLSLCYFQCNTCCTHILACGPHLHMRAASPSPMPRAQWLFVGKYSETLSSGVVCCLKLTIVWLMLVHSHTESTRCSVNPWQTCG
jgi:hypothetical protein